MAIVEDVTEHDAAHAGSAEVLAAVQQLSARLQLPKDVLDNSEPYAAKRYKEQALLVLHDMAQLLRLPGWGEVSVEDQAGAVQHVLRLDGEEEWTSPDIRSLIDNAITPLLSPSVRTQTLLSLRPHFSAHPSLSSASRPLLRPTGGPSSNIDLHDVQPFKSPSAVGIANLLAWSVRGMTASNLEKNIGTILPPTLVMMDDYEPSWRAKGAWVLSQWMEVDPPLLKRMGVAKLLLKSLVHTLSLHPNPPLDGVLEITLRFVDLTMGDAEGTKERTEVYEEVMDKAIVQAWIYAPSGVEGRVVLADIASKLEVMCGVFGVGIVRWLKTIIPSLLGPLQYPPTPVVLQHYQANLSALLCTLRTARPSGRIARWRGQIIHVLSRLVVQLQDRGLRLDTTKTNKNGVPNTDTDTEERINSLLRQIYAELADQSPSVRKEEYPRLLAVAPNIFQPYLSSPSSSPA